MPIKRYSLLALECRLNLSIFRPCLSSGTRILLILRQNLFPLQKWIKRSRNLRFLGVSTTQNVPWPRFLLGKQLLFKVAHQKECLSIIWRGLRSSLKQDLIRDLLLIQYVLIFGVEEYLIAIFEKLSKECYILAAREFR